mmetsp:Transcript_31416/g.61228  ORF Transcript_31416/g.61228 Transcript_31416/m.61228 type:complete len:615 (+) Transcript_31416:16-1860(+)
MPLPPPLPPNRAVSPPRTPSRVPVSPPPQPSSPAAASTAPNPFATKISQIQGDLAKMLSNQLKSRSVKEMSAPAQAVKNQHDITLEKKEKLASTRKKIIAEILETEENYNFALGVLLELYRIPLMMKPDLLSNNKQSILFGSIQKIVDMNSEFLKELVPAVGAEPQLIGPVFQKYAPLFEVYSDYVKNHEKASSLLAKIMDESKSKYAKFREFCQQQASDSKAAGLNLSSFLIMPIQRIPRYKLLLAEVIKNTLDTHPDINSLNGAHDDIRKTAIAINEAVREMENREKLKELSKLLEEKLLDEKSDAKTRRFLREGALTKVCRKEDKLFTFFLFSDLLIYAEKKLTSFKVHRKFVIDHRFLIVDIPDQKEEADASTATSPPFSWQVITSQKSFVVYAKDALEKKQWFGEMKDAADHFLKRTGRNKSMTAGLQPVWQSDKTHNSCPLCGIKFTFTRRRHHCRKCGVLACGTCSRFRVELPVENEMLKSRVCEKCAKEVGGATTDISEHSSISESISPTTSMSPTSLSSITEAQSPFSALGSPKPLLRAGSSPSLLRKPSKPSGSLVSTLTPTVSRPAPPPRPSRPSHRPTSADVRALSSVIPQSIIDELKTLGS